MQRSRLLIGLYLTAVFLYWVAQYLYMPTLPLYVALHTDNLAMVGVVLSMYGLWQAIIRIPLGIFADWLGWRKPLIIIGTTLAGLGAWVMGTADGVPQLLIGRTLTGLAAGTWVLFVVAFSSLFPPQETIRVTALITLISSVGRMLATASTGFLNACGGYALAFFAATSAAFLSGLMMLPISEQRRQSKQPSFQGLFTILLHHRVLLPSLLSMIMQYGVWSSAYGFLPILARALGASDVVQSLFISLNTALAVAGNMITAALVKRIGKYRLLYLSFILMACGIGIAAIASHLFMIFLALCALGLASGIGYPLLMGMSIEQVHDSERATAMGIHQAIYALGMFGGPWISGMLADVIGIQATLGVNAFLCLFLGVFGTYKFLIISN
ncbi:major facilitator superfamily MFS_1 [Candidatus Vecturithrix granuli]|uniref:Major facilitator superfamily MFS_1 n=1 Tax=Vecturithrix granuli TaxID=1499967 RepID=A0A081C3H0_VECG1|nr:major facilitator superfamily MFS_1 [Candidatus Vecturithrix granuli]